MEKGEAAANIRVGITFNQGARQPQANGAGGHNGQAGLGGVAVAGQQQQQPGQQLPGQAQQQLGRGLMMEICGAPCNRTHGCTKAAGHQGFCSGHKGFRRRPSCELLPFESSSMRCGPICPSSSLPLPCNLHHVGRPPSAFALL